MISESSYLTFLQSHLALSLSLIEKHFLTDFVALSRPVVFCVHYKTTGRERVFLMVLLAMAAANGALPELITSVAGAMAYAVVIGSTTG
jgi:hypothetical protein